MVYYYRIAGLLVQMETYGRTLEQAAAYITEKGTPDVVISSQAEALRETQPHLSLDDCEYLCTGSSFYRQLLDFDGMLIHASAVVKDGYAYLFSAPCGTGKSTHTNLWRKTFGEDRVLMLNDDKPALRREDGRWYAYGTPWSGKTAQNTNVRVPLGGVCVLQRGEKDEIEPFGGAAAAFALLEQTVRPAAPGSRAKLLELLDDMMTQIPIWKMRCTPAKEAALTSHSAMTAEVHKRWSK